MERLFRLTAAQRRARAIRRRWGASQPLSTVHKAAWTAVEAAGGHTGEAACGRSPNGSKHTVRCARAHLHLPACRGTCTCTCT